MSDIRNEHVNIESIQYLYRFSYILSMPQVESKVLTTRSAPPTLRSLSIFHTRLHPTRTAVAAARVFSCLNAF